VSRTVNRWGETLPPVARAQISAVDMKLAKDQLELLLQTQYQHPTGQLPAYEWNFGDVNPPVQAWAAIFLYRIELTLKSSRDLNFLKRCL
jgi:hypothetical protein